MNLLFPVVLMRDLTESICVTLHLNCLRDKHEVPGMFLRHPECPCENVE
jgi:hypothetical protein